MLHEEENSGHKQPGPCAASDSRHTVPGTLRSGAGALAGGRERWAGDGELGQKRPAQVPSPASSPEPGDRRAGVGDLLIQAERQPESVSCPLELPPPLPPPPPFSPPPPHPPPPPRPPPPPPSPPPPPPRPPPPRPLLRCARIPGMDVRFYPAAPTAVGALPGADPTCLGHLDYYHCNKFDGENMYMGMNEANQEFLSANQPSTSLTKASVGGNLLTNLSSSAHKLPRERGKYAHGTELLAFDPGQPWQLPLNLTYNGQSENNEDYEIPPITPPNLPDPSLLHLVDHETGYHSLCHSLPPNSLIPTYSYQNMDLPAIMVSNMLTQDGHLLSSQLPTSTSYIMRLQ
ncbi:uncharacterized protein ACOB8E_009951 [Sarcophilus harrisii]